MNLFLVNLVRTFRFRVHSIA